MPKHMTEDPAYDLYKKYCCAHCFKPLTLVRHGYNNIDVYCPDCGEDAGFVTFDYANKRKQESDFELAEAKRNLGKILGQVEPPSRFASKSADEILNIICPK